MKRIDVQDGAYRCCRSPAPERCSARGLAEQFRVSPRAGEDTCPTTNRIKNLNPTSHIKALCKRNAGDPWSASTERFWRTPPKVRATQLRNASPEKPRTRQIDAGGRTALLCGEHHNRTARSNSTCVPRKTRAYRDLLVRISSVFPGLRCLEKGGNFSGNKNPCPGLQKHPKARP